MKNDWKKVMRGLGVVLISLVVLGFYVSIGISLSDWATAYYPGGLGFFIPSWLGAPMLIAGVLCIWKGD